MAKKDYYEVLGVDRNADEQTIKKAYRRLSMKFHPDRNINNKKDAEKNFKEIQEAYSVISDSNKRATYDQFGHDAVSGNAAGGNAGNPFNASGFGDIFGDIFGGGGSRQQSNKGSDLRYHLEINLKQAVFGDTVKVRIPKDEVCTTCNGSGAKPGTSVKTCSSCHGHGQVQIQQGFFSIQRPCSKCSGSGEIVDHPCPACRGKGTQRRQKTLSVKIPAGIDSGNRIRLTGEGAAGIRSSAAGDLYVELTVKSHNIFTREGNNLLVDVPIDFAVAALGGSVEVPTLNDKLKLKIPAGTQTNKLFRLKGKGVPFLRGSGSGDLFARVKIETPVNLSGKQKELLQRFVDSCGKKQHPESNSFFSKMKSFFE